MIRYTTELYCLKILPCRSGLEQFFGKLIYGMKSVSSIHKKNYKYWVVLRHFKFDNKGRLFNTTQNTTGNAMNQGL